MKPSSLTIEKFVADKIEAGLVGKVKMSTADSLLRAW